MSENKDVVKNTEIKKEEISEDAKKYEKQVKKYTRAKVRPFNLFCAMSGFLLLFVALVLAECFCSLSVYLYAIVFDQKFYFPGANDIVLISLVVTGIVVVLGFLIAIIVTFRKRKNLKPAGYEEPVLDKAGVKKRRRINGLKFLAGFLLPVILSGVATCLIVSNAYEKAIEDYENLNYEKSNATFMVLGNYKDSKERIVDISKEIAISRDYIARIDRKTKKVNIEWTGDSEERNIDVSEWENIVIIDVGYHVTLDGTLEYIVGVTEDGRVLFSGNNENIKATVAKWDNIVDICAENEFLIALKNDGTVVAAGDNHYGQCDVSDWKDIVKIESDDTFSMGITENGDIVCTNENLFDHEDYKGRKFVDVAPFTVIDVDGKDEDYRSPGWPHYYCDVKYGVKLSSVGAVSAKGYYMPEIPRWYEADSMAVSVDVSYDGDTLCVVWSNGKTTMHEQYEKPSSGSSGVSYGAGGYEMPNENDDSVADYIQRVDPDLYNSMQDRYYDAVY